MTTMVLSINNLKRVVDSISTNLNYYDAGKIDIAQLLEYEENNILNVLEIINLLYENKMKYNKSIEEKKALVASFVEMDKVGILSGHIKKWN